MRPCVTVSSAGKFTHCTFCDCWGPLADLARATWTIADTFGKREGTLHARPLDRPDLDNPRIINNFGQLRLKNTRHPLHNLPQHQGALRIAVSVWPPGVQLMACVAPLSSTYNPQLPNAHEPISKKITRISIMYRLKLIAHSPSKRPTLAATMPPCDIQLRRSILPTAVPKSNCHALSCIKNAPATAFPTKARSNPKYPAAIPQRHHISTFTPSSPDSTSKSRPTCLKATMIMLNVDSDSRVQSSSANRQT